LLIFVTVLPGSAGYPISIGFLAYVMHFWVVSCHMTNINFILHQAASNTADHGT